MLLHAFMYFGWNARYPRIDGVQRDREHNHNVEEYLYTNFQIFRNYILINFSGYGTINWYHQFSCPYFLPSLSLQRQKGVWPSKWFLFVLFTLCVATISSLEYVSCNHIRRDKNFTGIATHFLPVFITHIYGISFHSRHKSCVA